MRITTDYLFKSTMNLIDEVNTDGTLNANSVAAYKSRLPFLITSLQDELLEQGEIYKTYNITKSRIDATIGSFDQEQHKDEDVIYSVNKKVKAYTFEIDGIGTVYIEEHNGTNWEVLEQIDITTNPKGFERYYGILSGSHNKSRIRFSGDYFYNFGNYALFDIPFSSEDDIPEYKEFIKYEMPDDFNNVSAIIEESLTQDYVKTVDYFWEKGKDLYLSYDLTGNIRINYLPVLEPITTIDEETYIDVVTTKARTILMNGLAAMLLAPENANLANYFQQRFEELKMSNKSNQPVTIDEIQDLYGTRD